LNAKLDSDIAGNSTLMSMEQWATGKLLSDPQYGFTNFTAYNSSYYTGMNFVYEPEYSVALEELCSQYTNAEIDYLTASELFSVDLSGDVTLLNPENMFDLYSTYWTIGITDYNYIMTRWNFPTVNSVTCFMTYLKTLQINNRKSMSKATSLSLSAR
jgi:hypothetical protein